MTDRKDIDLAELRTRLETRRAELLAHSSHSEDYRKPVELDQQAVGRLSRMDAKSTQITQQVIPRTPQAPRQPKKKT